MADMCQTSSLDTDFLAYFKSWKGLVHVVEIVLCIIIVICFATSWYQKFIIVSIFEAIFSIILLIIFALNLEEMFSIINFRLTDLLNSVSACLVFFIVSLVCLTSWWADTAAMTGAGFGLLAAVAYGCNACITLKEIRENGMQGGGLVLKYKRCRAEQKCLE